MRIGVNCFLLREDIGGLRQYFFSLFDELLERDPTNEYIFFHFAHNEAELAALGSSRWQSAAILLDNQDQAREHLDKIDLYFCPFGALWPRPLPMPTVVTLVDIQEAFYPEFFTPIDHYNREFHFPSSTRMADRVITVSEFSKSTIVRRHGISPGKVVVAHLCPDARYYRARDVGRRPASSLPERGFVLYPANRWKHKNHDALLQAIRWLRDERGLKIDAVFTGHDVPNGYPLEQMASEYGVAEQIHCLGYVTVEELAYLYSRAAMLVFPSLFEGFGLPVIEAMAAGCPVAAAADTSLPEAGADAVEYFDPASPYSIGSAIEKLWRNPLLREQLADRGRRRVSHFSATQMAQAHLFAFDEATRAFSWARYAWHRWVYRYYHGARVHFKYREVLSRESL
jgi:glycosyltransferase involved in cell wall biosynthesis